MVDNAVGIHVLKVANSSSRPAVSLWWLFPVVVFLVHASWYGFIWIIDDAGISFAYAKNLAAGHGLVSQPGVAPVEGFSNPLWVFLFTPFFVLQVFDLSWTPKIVSLCLVIAAFGLTLHNFSIAFPHCGRWAAVLGLTLVSLQPAFVIWCVSGLENPLTIFLVSALAAVCVNFSTEKPVFRQAAFIGLVTAALALNRPDGLLYLGFFPLVLFLNPYQKNTGFFRPLGTFFVFACVPILIYLGFRFIYFDAFLPNTYYAKGGVSASKLVAVFTFHPDIIIKLQDLFGSIAGQFLGGWLAILSGLLLVRFFLKGRRNIILLVSGVGLVLSAGIYLLLPYDWMPEFRFATPFFFFFYLFASGSYCVLMSETLYSKGLRIACKFAGAIFCIGVLSSSSVRAFNFKYHMPIPVSEVIETSQRFELYSQQLQIQSPSILIADIGGFLYRNRIRVFDLGMLTDKTVSATLGEGSRSPDVERFHNYIFDEIKPAFIATRAYHSFIADLDSDSRFREFYTPIFEYEDKWIGLRRGKKMASGDFVRKDLIVGRDVVFENIRASARSVPYAGK